MNILQLVPKLNVGGVEKGTVEVARHLTLNGHKAVVVSGGGMFEKNLAAVGARHYNILIGSKNPFVMFLSYIKLKNVIRKENIDIIHARSRIPALIGFFAARATQKTFITTAHGQYKKHLISRVMGWGKIVIAANETMARYMKENFGVPLERMVIIPRGVDLKKFSFVSPREKSNKVFRVGMISRLTPLKGHPDFLQAMAYVSRRVHNLEIVIMGDRKNAKEEYIKKIDLTVKRLMLGNIVRFVESDQDVAEVLKTFNVLVSANRSQEAFGRTVVEAQARGVPVVATRVGGVAENIDDGNTGLLCEPTNHQEMAEKVLRLAENQELAQTIAVKAREFVEKKYSLEKVMAATLKAYMNVLKLKKILVFKISSLGDVVLCVPSLRALRERYKNACIKILVDLRFREVLDNCPYVDEIITCDFKLRDRFMGFLRLAERLRAENFDISIDLQNSRRSHILAFLGAINERFGYANGKLSFLLNRKISLPAKAVNPVDHQAVILGLLGITRIDKRLELWPGEESEKWAETFIADSWLKSGQKLVALSISASRRWKTKNWGLTKFVELADMLARERGIRVVLLGTEEDKEDGAEFMKMTTAKPVNAIGKTNISRLVSLIKRCDVLVTGDSAPMHIAAGMGTPFVVIFGPTDPARHLVPYGRYKMFFDEKLKCAPCYKPMCPSKNRCMASIKAADVFKTIVELMEG